MEGIYGIDLSNIKSELRYVPEMTQDDGLEQNWLLDGKIDVQQHRWSAGWSQAGGGKNKKGVFCGGTGHNWPLLRDKNGCPCQAYVEQLTKVLFVQYMNAYTSMGANRFVVCTDTVSSLVNLMELARGGRKHHHCPAFYELLGMLASELVGLLAPRNAEMTVIHKKHPEAYQGWAKAQNWDPDRVAALGMLGCDMKQCGSQRRFTDSVFKQLEFSEEVKANEGSLLLSVKITVVAGLGDQLPLALRPSDVWIRTHLDNIYLWRNVKTNEWFWEQNAGVWKRYRVLINDVELYCWNETKVGGSTGRYFYEHTGGVDP